jgi:hypothetical protein
MRRLPPPLPPPRDSCALLCGSSLSSRFSAHPPKIFARGCTGGFAGAGLAPSEARESVGCAGVIGPGAACARAAPGCSAADAAHKIATAIAFRGVKKSGFIADSTEPYSFPAGAGKVPVVHSAGTRSPVHVSRIRKPSSNPIGLNQQEQARRSTPSPAAAAPGPQAPETAPPAFGNRVFPAAKSP